MKITKTLKLRNALLALALIGIGATTLNFSGSQTANAACSALPTDRGTATATVNIPSGGTYRVWSRILAPSSSANSYFLQIDESYCNIVVGNATIPTNTYIWVDYKSGNKTNTINVNLSAGNHTIKVAGREDNVRLDKVIFVSDTSCVPTGDGSNCASSGPSDPGSPGQNDGPSTPPKENSPKEVGLPTGNKDKPVPLEGTVVLQPESLDEDTERIEYYIDGELIEDGILDTTKLQDGEYEIEIRQYKSDGSVETETSTIMVDNEKTVLEKLSAVATANPPLTGAIAVAVVALAVVGGYLYIHRYPVGPKLSQRIRSLFGRGGGPQDSSGDSGGSTVIHPQS